MVLEGTVHIIQFLLKLLLSLLGNISNNIYRSFVLPGSKQECINIILFDEDVSKRKATI